jgi:hypothetical protein
MGKEGMGDGGMGSDEGMGDRGWVLGRDGTASRPCVETDAAARLARSANPTRCREDAALPEAELGQHAVLPLPHYENG